MYIFKNYFDDFILIYFLVFHERALFVREKAQGAYRTSAYFLAKTLCDIVPMRVVPPIILGTVTYWMVTHPQSDPEWAHYLWCVLVLILVSVVSWSRSLQEPQSSLIHQVFQQLLFLEKSF